MLRRTLLALALMSLLAAPATLALPTEGDAGTGRDAPQGPTPSFLVETDVEYSATLTMVADAYDTYAFEGAEGDLVTVVAYGTVCWTLLDPARVARDNLCNYAEVPSTEPEAFPLDADGVWFVRFSASAPGPYRFVIARDEPAPDLTLTGGLAPGGRIGLAPGGDPTCGTGAPVTATFGAGDAALPTLAYAALKTGFRAVVAWETAGPSAATLTVSLDGGAPVTLAEATPREQHVFVLDGLPEGRALCFTPQGGSAHALRLANAMNAHDGDAYSLNLLVLANEQPDREALEAGLDDYARLLHDATDGAVRSGLVLTLYGDLERHNSGWATCYITSIATGDRPLCRNVHDVLFTYDGSIGGAAQTYRDGIQDPEQAIWMNQYLQAPLVGLADDVGNVLVHEMGHYAFGMMDLYGSLAGTDADCWDPAKGLSVMGGSRDATEFDDEVNRCPNEEIIAGYVPSWTLLRARFPLVPDRAGVIDAGPSGDGGDYALHSFVFAPQASEVELQDDAGSGRDASDTPSGAVRIEPGVVYDATGLGFVLDLFDHYAFHAEAGQVLEAMVDGSLGCYTVYLPSGAELASACSYAGAPLNTGPVVATLPESGDYVLEVANLAPALYRFAVALDEPLPPVARL